MRRLVFLGYVLAVLGAGLSTRAQVSVGSDLSVPGEEALLQSAIQDGRAVRPEQVVESIRGFLGRSDVSVRIRRFKDPGDIGYDGTHYNAVVDDGPGSDATGDYDCRALSGRVFGFGKDRTPGSAELPPAIDRAEAHEVARQFVLQKCPEFSARQWAEDSSWADDAGDDFQFSWTEVLNDHGTRAVYDLRVSVERCSGRVVYYQFPPDRVAAPLVPGITLEQAKTLAAEFAVYDPAIVPFDPCFPKLLEDETGIQSLWWELHQPVQEPGAVGVRVLHVEALNGAEIIPPPAPLGQVERRAVRREPWRSAWSKRSAALHRKLAARVKPGEPKARIAHAGGRPLDCSVSPVIRDGRVWLRAELLRLFEARPYTTGKGLLLRAEDRRLLGAECNARYRDHGWWVPLRKVGEAFGWKVAWSPKGRTAVVLAL